MKSSANDESAAQPAPPRHAWPLRRSSTPRPVGAAAAASAAATSPSATRSATDGSATQSCSLSSSVSSASSMRRPSFSLASAAHSDARHAWRGRTEGR
eukprot:16815-Chlamydomonas_euryale.AAC.2